MPKQKPTPADVAPKSEPAGAEHATLKTDSVEALLQLMVRYDVTELRHVRETKESLERLVLKRERAGVAAGVAAHVPMAPVHMHAPVHAPAPAKDPATEKEDEGTVYITSPLVGTFYRAPRPEAPPFIDVGQRIRPGQKLCIVEAMKLMNEIEAEVEGTILEVLVENGKSVEYGQRLFRVSKA